MQAVATGNLRQLIGIQVFPTISDAHLPPGAVNYCHKVPKCKIHVPKALQLKAYLNPLTCNFLIGTTYIYFEITITSYEHEPEHVN